MIGIRYVQNDGKIYFITIECDNCLNDYGYPKGKSFYTHDCIVKKIEEADTGLEIDSIYGKGCAGNNYEYRKNERITGRWVYFCDCKNTLLELSFVDKDSSGHYFVSGRTFLQRYINLLTQKMPS